MDGEFCRKTKGCIHPEGHVGKCETASPEEKVRRLMGPPPEGWEWKGATWVRGDAQVCLVGSEWVVKWQGKGIASVSSKEAALSHAAGKLGMADMVARASPSAQVAPPTVDPWKAFGLAVMDLLNPPHGTDVVEYLRQRLNMAAAADTYKTLADEANARERALEARLERFSKIQDAALAKSPLETWHRLTSNTGSCAVLELVTEGGRILSRREVVQQDRRHVQLPKVEDLMSKAAKA